MMNRGTLTIDELLSYGVDLGLRDYPVIHEECRNVINEQFIDYYRFREIGYENYNMFVNRLNVAMKRIMYNRYNRMFKVLETDFNPLFNIDITETYEGKNDGTFTNTSSTENSSEYSNENGVESSGREENTANNKATNSNFPSQSMTESETESYGYIDNLQRSNANNTSTNESNVSTSESGNTKNNLTSDNSGNTIANVKYTKKTQGSSAGLPFSKAMEQYKEFNDRVANIIEQIIHDPAITSLFLNVW